jgi:hypothetical protein
MKIQYVKQPSGAILAFEACYVTNDAGKEVQVTSAVGEPATKAAYEKQEAKREKEKAAYKAEALKPVSVTMRQARLALLEAGLLDNVQNIVAGMQGVEGTAARIEWEYSSTMVRSQPLVAQLAAVLKLKPADVDALFLSASTK